MRLAVRYRERLAVVFSVLRHTDTVVTFFRQRDRRILAYPPVPELRPRRSFRLRREVWFAASVVGRPYIEPEWLQRDRTVVV